MQEPKTKDDWFLAIRDCIHAFEREKGYTPNEAQAWAHLIRTAPGDYGIEVRIRSHHKELVLPDGKPMDRENFHRRFIRLYPDPEK